MIVSNNTCPLYNVKFLIRYPSLINTHFLLDASNKRYPKILVTDKKEAKSFIFFSFLLIEQGFAHCILFNIKYKHLFLLNASYIF